MSKSRPFSDAYLLAYSDEHIKYEFEMFIWLGQVFSNLSVSIGAPSARDATLLNYVLIESFAVHVRNIIDFLYKRNPKSTDVVAADFFDPGAWAKIRPPQSSAINAAHFRANKEIAHLSTERIAGNPPEKEWPFADLVVEMKPLLRLFASNALTSRCSPTVAFVVH